MFGNRKIMVNFASNIGVLPNFETMVLLYDGGRDDIVERAFGRTYHVVPGMQTHADHIAFWNQFAAAAPNSQFDDEWQILHVGSESDLAILRMML